MEGNEKRIRLREEESIAKLKGMQKELQKIAELEGELKEYQTRLPLLLEMLRNKESADVLTVCKIQNMEKEIEELKLQNSRLRDDLSSSNNDLKDNMDRNYRYREMCDQLELALEVSNRKTLELEQNVTELNNNLKTLKVLMTLLFVQMKRE